jgi:hypothetical protein
MTAAMNATNSKSAPAAVDKAPQDHLSPLLCGFAPLRDSIIGQRAKPELLAGLLPGSPEFQRR